MTTIVLHLVPQMLSCTTVPHLALVLVTVTTACKNIGVGAAILLHSLPCQVYCYTFSWFKLYSTQRTRVNNKDSFNVNRKCSTTRLGKCQLLHSLFICSTECQNWKMQDWFFSSEFFHLLFSHDLCIKHELHRFLICFYNEVYIN